MLIGRGAGLRVDADLGRRRHHRHLRRDALRRLEGALRATRASAGRWRRSTPARSPRAARACTSRSGARSTGRCRLRARRAEQQAGGAVDPALELRARDGRPAVQPADDVRPRAPRQGLRPRRVQDAADLQLVLREHQRVGVLHLRAAAAASEGRQPRPAGQRRGQVRVEGLPGQLGAPAGDQPVDRLHRQLEQQAGQGLPGLRRPLERAGGSSVRGCSPGELGAPARSRRWPTSWPRPTPRPPRTSASSSCGRR